MTTISEDLRQAAKCIHIVVEPEVAESVDKLLIAAAIWIEALEAKVQRLEQLLIEDVE